MQDYQRLRKPARTKKKIRAIIGPMTHNESQFQKQSENFETNAPKTRRATTMKTFTKFSTAPEKFCFTNDSET